MAILHNTEDTSEHVLTEHCLVGRHPSCELLIADKTVSGEHARMTWSGSLWTLRDLGSSNGTFVNGERLNSGEDRKLLPRDLLVFGTCDPWLVVNLDPPGAFLRDLDSGVYVPIQGDVFALPDDSEPELSLYMDRDGRWLAESADGEPTEVNDGDTLSAGGRRWMVSFGDPGASTVPARPALRMLDRIHLHIRRSADHQRVDVQVQLDEQQRTLKPRAHHLLLAALAEVRVADRDNPNLSEAEAGWVHREDLCRELGVGTERLRLDVYRIRKDLAAADIQGAGNIVERRAVTGQMRLGIKHVTLEEKG